MGKSDHKTASQDSDGADSHQPPAYPSLIERNRILEHQLKVAQEEIKRLQAEHLLSQKKGALAECTHDPVAIFNGDGYIEWVNEAFNQYWGYQLGEAIGQSLGSAAPVDLNGENLEKIKAVWEHIAARQPIKVELQRTRENGQVERIYAVNQPIFDKSGNFLAYLLVEHDITGQKASADALETYQALLAELRQAKINFVTNMSHELYTPLNGISGVLNLLTLTEVDDEQAEYLDIIKQSSEQLRNIVDQVLDLTTVSADANQSVYEFVRLPKKLKKIVKPFLERAASKRVDLRIDIDPSIPAIVEAPIKTVEKILTHLIDNGLKFTSTGEVVVFVRTVVSEDLPKFLFGVQDTGIGIEEKDLPKLFDDFFQADASLTREYGGVGLGLSIARTYADRLGIPIRVMSKVGEGSTFSFEVPRSDFELNNSVKKKL